MDVTFTRIAGHSKGYWASMLVMAGFAAAGVVATFVLIAEGLHLTGMTNRIPWGIQVTFADYYIGLSAGAMLVSGLYGVFGRVRYKPFARLAAFLGMLFLFAGLLSILTDQGRVDRALTQPISHFNLMSLFSINPFLYFGNIVLCIIYLYALIKEKPRLTRIVAVVVVGWGFVLHTGTGAILGFIPRELHQSALLPMCFLAAALASGMAVMILVIVALFRLTKRKLEETLVSALGKYLGVFALVVIYFLLVDIAYRFYLIESREAAEYFLFGGFHSVLFWVGLMLMGCLIPIAILFHPRKGKSLPWVVASAILVVFGVWCERYVLVFPGQTNPPDLFPGMQITSSQLVEGYVSYSVTWYEVFQILGVLGVLGILFMLGLRWFRLMPTEARLAGASAAGR